MAITLNQNSSEHRAYQAIAWGLLAAVLFLMPFLLPDFQLGRLNRAIAIAVAVLGLNLVVGYSGLLALCQSAFIAIGAFMVATLVQDHGWDYWLTVPVAMFVAFLWGLLLGIPALRIKGLYLAMATVAFATAFPGLTKLDMGAWFGGLTIADRTGGANGKEIDEKLLAPQWLQDQADIFADKPSAYRYLVILAMAIVAFWAVSNLVKSRPGRAIVAIRDNETGAAVSGVNVRRAKVLNFGISAALGGLGGAMWAMNTGFVGETSFTFVLMVELLVALVVGGVATIEGAVIGALIVVFVQEWSKNQVWDLGFYILDGNGPLSQAIFGVVLILVVFFAPQGIAGLLRRLRNKVVQIVPEAPPLVAGTTSLSGALEVGGPVDSVTAEAVT